MSTRTVPRTPPLARQSLSSPITTAEDRHSLPRRASAMSAGLSADQRRARRAEMRSFYGLKPGPSDVRVGESPGSGNGDPLDVDSPGFNANAFLQDLAGKSTLEELMKKGSELAADVGDLQGSRHSLVYNHHHQLFAAGDTISRLNSRTPQLLGIMTNLQQSFSEISRLADEVVVEEPKNAEGKRWENELRRLRLMIFAEEPVDVIRERFEKVRKEAESVPGNEAAQRALKDCRNVVKGLWVEEAPKEDGIETAEGG